MTLSRDLERRIEALEERSREQDKLIAYLYARTLPNPYSLAVTEVERPVLQGLKEKMRQVMSGEKRVRSWNIEIGEPLSPEFEE